MPGEPENQFSLTRAAFSTSGRAKGKFPSVDQFVTSPGSNGLSKV